MNKYKRETNVVYFLNVSAGNCMFYNTSTNNTKCMKHIKKILVRKAFFIQLNYIIQNHEYYAFTLYHK